MLTAPFFVITSAIMVGKISFSAPSGAKERYLLHIVFFLYEPALLFILK